MTACITLAMDTARRICNSCSRSFFEQLHVAHPAELHSALSVYSGSVLKILIGARVKLDSGFRFFEHFERSARAGVEVGIPNAPRRQNVIKLSTLPNMKTEASNTADLSTASLSLVADLQNHHLVDATPTFSGGSACRNPTKSNQLMPIHPSGRRVFDVPAPSPLGIPSSSSVIAM